jgi:predicted MFS family arabinose efflux permease
VIETRSEHPMLQTRLLRDRDRTGANLIMVCVGAATFGMFFFLTLFMQSVWGYSALKTGLAYLPLTAGIVVSSGATAQLIPRLGGRPLLLTGAPTTAGGLYWLSRLSEHGSYVGAVLGRPAP